jgi:tetratricopeptide (TPR) repeat protein
MARLQNRRIKEAMAAFKTAIEQTPKHPEAYYRKGDLLLLQGDRPGALECYRKPTELNPKSVTAQLQLSTFQMNLGDMPGAVASARIALELGPRSVRAHAGLIMSLMKSGNGDEAFRRAQEALRLLPEAAELHHSMGMTLYLRGELDKAVQSIQRAIDRPPPRAVFHCDLGLALRARGDLEEALAAFRSAIHLSPKESDWHWVLAETLFGMGRLEEAHAAAAEATKRNPVHVPSSLLRAVILIESGDLAESREQLRRIQTQLPFLDVRHRNIRELLAQCERMDQARQKLPAVLAGQEKPANAEEQLAVGMLCARAHRKTHAAAAVRFFTDGLAAAALNAEKHGSHRRFQAACCAILAGTGASEDSKELDAAKRSDLRRQAHRWLLMDLAGMQKTIADRKPIAYPAVQYRLWHWKKDPALAAVRDPERLALLPAEEAEAWQNFWAEVEVLRKKASG